MKILIADDDPISRVVMERTLTGWQHEVVVATCGKSAWEILCEDDAPRLAIIDWMMPDIDGAEICRRVRALRREVPTYLILLSARHQTQDVVDGLDAGADDYVVKPFNRSELRARIRAGERIVALQEEQRRRIRDLEAALQQVDRLQGLLPICGYCKSIRNDENYWQQVESYFCEHSALKFSHGICPGCYQNIVVPELAAAGIAVDPYTDR